MLRSVSNSGTDSPSSRCGYDVLSSFEWSENCPGAVSPSASNNIEKSVLGQVDKQLPTKDDKMTTSGEVVPRMKRPSAFISSDNSSIPVMPRDHHEMEGIRGTKRACVLTSNNLQDIIQCGRGDYCPKVIVTSASFPYHVEWVSSSWSKSCGWSCDEVLGLDCKFLQGDATDMREIGRFMTQLMSSGGHASLDVLNYNKDDTLHRVALNCIPIVDDCGPNCSKRVTHIVAVLVDSREELHSTGCGEQTDFRELSEVGMPLDRREGCRSCTNLNQLTPISSFDWITLTDSLPLAHMMRYMIRSQAPIALTDREDRIVHVNVAWVNLTGCAAVDCEGVSLMSLLDDNYDLAGLRRHQQTMAALTSASHCSSAFSSNVVNLRRHHAYRPLFHSSGSQASARSGPFDVDNLPISRTGSTNSSSPLCDGPPSYTHFTPVELTPVPIGGRHFAVLCIAQHTA